ncbi:MAG TPA: peroxiredoxin [Steroidobacter sp.]|uniref:peroxiredoxin n=1 Tax=Steroidobacter sp. TaxID=1978227 RepID=UPI002ED7B7AA
MIKVGDKMPAGTLTHVTKDGPQKVNAEDFFKGRKVVLFSVPGAFTPTCDAKHLPGFVEKAADIKAKGVDVIACMAVNDAFVMSAWGKSHNTDGKVEMLADGNAEYTKALGLEMDATGFGMGVRGQRFSLVVDDGVVKQVNVEQKGEFKVSSAEHVLTQL